MNKNVNDKSGLEQKQNSSEVGEIDQKARREAIKEKYRSAKLQYTGRLYVDEKYKKPDKVLRIDNDNLATRNYLRDLGYTPVIDPDQLIKADNLKNPQSLGSEVHMEQSIYGESQPGLLYECDKETYDVRMELEAEENAKRLYREVESVRIKPFNPNA